jgi:DNA-binding NarL/FixJ family response regulator
MAELSEYIDKVDLIAHNDPAKGINTFSRNMGNTPFDIVILDLSLKGYRTGGLEVLKELKYIDSEIKVIVFSGHSTKPVVAHYKDYGFNARLEKPCSKQQLENAIYKLIDK